MGSKLISAQAVKSQDYDGIAKKTFACIGWIKNARMG